MVGCLDDIVGVVARSAEVNHAQLVAKQNGRCWSPHTTGQKSFSPTLSKLLSGASRSTTTFVFTAENQERVC